MKQHKVFISFYHFDDQKYKNYLINYYQNYIIDKSVCNGEYDSDNSDEYVKRLIRDEKISDSSVILVLCGLNTFKRKHVDWEIYAGLRDSINGNSGLAGILLPSFPMYYGGKYDFSYLPKRLYDNVISGYAKLYTWEYTKNNFLNIIDETFQRRVDYKDKKDNARKQMQYNLI